MFEARSLISWILYPYLASKDSIFIEERDVYGCGVKMEEI